MKHIPLIILFTIGTILPTFSQVDTTSYMSKYKVDNTFGFSFFGGLGVGGNGIKQGFARGLDTRFHYRSHTFDTYASRTTEYEAEYAYGSKDLTLTYDSHNYGLTYGLGIYKEHFSAACVAGIGYSSTTMIIVNPDLNSIPYTIYLHKDYSKVSACFGLQAGVRKNIFGLSAKFYCNVSDGHARTNYNVLFGLDLNFGQFLEQKINR
jgi:hypothetical protein